MVVGPAPPRPGGGRRAPPRGARPRLAPACLGARGLCAPAPAPGCALMTDWGVAFRFVGLVAVGKALSHHVDQHLPEEYHDFPTLVLSSAAMLVFFGVDMPHLLHLEEARTRMQIETWLRNTKQDRPFDPHWLDPKVPPPRVTPRRWLFLLMGAGGLLLGHLAHLALGPLLPPGMRCLPLAFGFIMYYTPIWWEDALLASYALRRPGGPDVAPAFWPVPLFAEMGCLALALGALANPAVLPLALPPALGSWAELAFVVAVPAGLRRCRVLAVAYAARRGPGGPGPP